MRATRAVAANREDGSISAFAVLLSLALAAMLGLVAEGGQVLIAREAAMAEAEQAARAGAAQLSPATIHSGGIIDPGDGPVRVAEAAMAAAGHAGTARVAGSSVTARVTPFEVATPLLALVGIPRVTVTASATAQAVDG